MDDEYFYRPRKHPKREDRKVRGDWPDDKIIELIRLVQERPDLWDISSATYRISKPTVWQEVANELDTDSDWRDCRAKWQTLRVTYNCNVAKAEKKRETEETAPVIPWRFFNAMRFIGRSERQLAEQPSSNSNLNLDDCTETTVDSTPSFSAPQHTEQRDKTETPPAPYSHRVRRKRHFLSTATQTPPQRPSSSTVDNGGSLGGLAEHLLQLVSRRDEHTIFGDYMASELRRLPADDAFALRRRLNRTLLDFWDDKEAATTAPSPSPFTIKELKEEFF